MELDLDEQEMRPRGLVGLTNIGNTCYMNSALQALSNCPQLTRFFLKCDDFLAWPPEGKRLLVSRCFKDIICEMWSPKRPKCLTPSILMRAIRSHNPLFRGYAQQDTQEFLRCIMDCLHEELKQEVNEHCKADLGDTGDSSIHVYSNKKKLLGGNASSDGKQIPSGIFVCDSIIEMDVDENHSDLLLSKHRKRTISCSTRKELRRSHNKSQPNKDSSRQEIKYRSIITCVFDGKLLSSVQCLTCHRISNTIEIFQDLSLPVPTSADLNQMHSKAVLSCAPDMYNDTGWFSYLWGWMKSWVVGPEIKLEDCLAAFFTNDELKGDNMYSCEKCKKLRNGIKYSRVNFLPEILCIHLKRFRHDLYHSSKINTFISFPLDNLDMQPFLSKDCVSSKTPTSYNLTAVICHFGSVGGGHYIAYAKNCINNRWYEFNDSYVCEVSETTVVNAEAYVLFYSLKDEKADLFRKDINHKLKTSNKSEDVCYISKEWMNRFDSCVQPGPVSNYDFICQHGGINLESHPYIQTLVAPISKSISRMFIKRFGGGPEINNLDVCTICRGSAEKKEYELRTFTKLQETFLQVNSPDVVYYISMAWYNSWSDYVNGKREEHPGQIDNSDIVQLDDDKEDSNYGLISDSAWDFLHSQYGGGPVICVRSNDKNDNQSDKEEMNNP